MLTKLLLTLAIIAAAYLFLRYRRRQASAGPRVEPAADESVRRTFSQLAAALLVVITIMIGAFFLHRWYDDRTLMEVRVIDTRSGEVSRYQAYKGDLEGRSFLTIEGRAVSIADSERMEVQRID